MTSTIRSVFVVGGFPSSIRFSLLSSPSPSPFLHTTVFRLPTAASGQCVSGYESALCASVLDASFTRVRGVDERVSASWFVPFFAF